MRLSQTQLALLAMIGASALIAVTSLLAKALGLSGLHPLQVSAGRFVFALTALTAFLALRPAQRPSLKTAKWRTHLARSICGWSGVTFMFAAAARMPLAEATAISFLSPIVTMGFAILLLGENATTRKIVASLLALAGALILLQPGTEAFRPAALLAIAAALLLGIEAMFIKRLTGTEPPLRILAINNMIGAAVALPVAAAFWVWPSALQWAGLVLLGTVMICAQTLFIQSMKRGQASVVMPASYTTLIFAALYDLVLFNTQPATMALAGAALIIAAALLLALPQKAQVLRSGEH